MFDFEPIGRRAKEASRSLALAGTEQKNRALSLIAEELIKNKRAIIDQNRLDVKAAEAKGVKSSLVDRLYLNEKRIEGIADGVEKVVSLPDPVGMIEYGETRPNGLRVLKQRVPLGTVGIIYESGGVFMTAASSAPSGWSPLCPSRCPCCTSEDTPRARPPTR